MSLRVDISNRNLYNSSSNLAKEVRFGELMSTTSKAESAYWNPFLETLSHQQIKELQFIRFKEIFEYARKHASSYRDLYRQYKITVENLNQPEDIRKLLNVGREFFEAETSESPYDECLLKVQYPLVPSSEREGITIDGVIEQS